MDKFHFDQVEEPDREFRRYIQSIFREYNEENSTVRGPDARTLTIRVRNEHDEVIGGAIILLYWGWVVIDVLGLEKKVRGQGLGRRLMEMIEEIGWANDCTRVHTTAYDFQALDFYRKLGYRIVGQLEDYPDGYTLYWIRKDMNGRHAPDSPVQRIHQTDEGVNTDFE